MQLNRWFWPGVFALIATVCALEVRSARLETQTWDEGIHLAAGYEYWARGDFTWNVEHPPLVKLICALPVRFMAGVSLPKGDDTHQMDETTLGRALLYKSVAPPAQILFAARAAAIALNLGLLCVFAWWMRRRFGALAAALATAMLALDPNMIAHSRYVTTDAGITILFFLTCVLWVEYLEDGSRRRLWWAAGALAVSLLTKFSALLLPPVMAGLFAFAWWRRPAEFSKRRAFSAAAALAVASILAIAICYWPDTLRCLAGKQKPITDFASRDSLAGLALRWMGRTFHMPAHCFLQGVAYQASHSAGGHPSYLLGMATEKGGWWYYFPVVFAVKSTMAALAALVLALAAAVWAAWRRGATWLRETPLMPMGLLVPPLFYFAFSMNSSVNLGVRHILPVYPFIYVGVAVTLTAWTAKGGWRRRLGLCTAAVIVATQAAEFASITPDYLAFFNAPSGGPGNGPSYLVDSNNDWGQDVGKMARWVKSHGEDHVYLSYFGNYEFDGGMISPWGVQSFGYPDPLDEKGWSQMDGYAAAPVTVLQGAYGTLNQLGPLRLRQPVAKIGWSVWIYDLRKKRSGGETTTNGGH